MAVKRNAKKRYGKFIFCRAAFFTGIQDGNSGKGYRG